MFRWEIFTRQIPFELFSNHVLLSSQIDKLDIRPKPYPQDVPQELNELISECWDKTPSKRPEATEVRDRIERINAKGHSGNFSTSNFLTLLRLGI